MDLTYFHIVGSKEDMWVLLSLDLLARFRHVVGDTNSNEVGGCTLDAVSMKPLVSPVGARTRGVGQSGLLEYRFSEVALALTVTSGHLRLDSFLKLRRSSLQVALEPSGSDL